MRWQIRGLNKASNNIQDGISLLQVADGALNESHSILHRMRELSVQAANDTNTEDDRNALQCEITQLTSEIDRIANTTNFNSAIYPLKGNNYYNESISDVTVFAPGKLVSTPSNPYTYQDGFSTPNIDVKCKLINVDKTLDYFALDGTKICAMKVINGGYYENLGTPGYQGFITNPIPDHFKWGTIELTCGQIVQPNNYFSNVNCNSEFRIELSGDCSIDELNKDLERYIFTVNTSTSNTTGFLVYKHSDPDYQKKH